MKKPFSVTASEASICSPRGFRACGVSAGIKTPGRKDMALIVSDAPAALAALFTQNLVKAAPVLLCMRRLAAGRPVRAVVVNSGNANACTGQRGERDAERMARLTAGALGLDAGEVLVCSTGTIGRPLPMKAVARGILAAAQALSPAGGADAARAIMTTDTKPKTASAAFRADGRTVTVAGMAKGAGMICPDMATMLAFLATDAAVQPGPLQKCLAAAADSTLNAITVDGDQSTNDTVLLLANGMAGNRPLQPGHPAWRAFSRAVFEVMDRLAAMIAADGEGATKFVTLTVRGAPDRAAARQAAMTVANSLLVKTSWCGADPNWGRVMAALGRSGVPIRPEMIDIRYNGQAAVRAGRSAGLSERRLHAILAKPAFSMTIELNMGRGAFTVRTCDCSEEYVKINASYMT